MPQVIVEKDGQYLFLQHFADVQRFTLSPAKYRRRSAEACCRIAEQFQTIGVNAKAVTDDGQPLSSGETKQTSVADTRPTSFRGVTPRRGQDGRYYVSWQDSLAGTCSVSGSSPQEALDKLFNGMAGDARVQRFVATLPPEETPDSVPTPSAPQIPTPTDNGKVLRAADLNRTATLPERRIESPQPNPAFAYEQWEASASVQQIKDRFKTDPAFRQWYEGTNARLTEEQSRRY